MIIRLTVNGALRIMRASAAQAVKITRMARRHGLTFSTYPDYMACDALTDTVDGYDAAVRREECRIVPVDESSAKAREVDANVGHILAAL